MKIRTGSQYHVADGVAMHKIDRDGEVHLDYPVYRVYGRPRQFFKMVSRKPGSCSLSIKDEFAETHEPYPSTRPKRFIKCSKKKSRRADHLLDLMVD